MKSQFSKKTIVLIVISCAAVSLASCKPQAESPAESPAEGSAHSPQPAETQAVAEVTQDLSPPAETAVELAEKIRSGELTSETAVSAYLARIAAFDRQGPMVQSIIALNPDALDEARALDEEAQQGSFRGPLHGVPVLLKDNIESKELPTTAGSLALKDNRTGRDSPIVAELRKAGAIILGKTNLSEWANFRSEGSISGWSGIGGQTRNPHSLDRSPCGSSSGSGAAIAVQFAPLAIGTETNGSIICPSSMNGVVGFKPTVGLLSQQYIVPISSTQDTAGPITRSVDDAALMLSVMADGEVGSEEAARAQAVHDDYVESRTRGIEGMRIGVLRFAQGKSSALTRLFEAALDALESQGAVLVDIAEFSPPEDMGDNEYLVLKTEFKATLNAYLADSAASVTTRSLDALIDFNNDHSARELALFDQSILLASADLEGLDGANYRAALHSILQATRTDGLDALLQQNEVEVLIAPSNPPAFLIDAVYGDVYPGERVGAGGLAAIAGYPSLTVPMGMIRGLPAGLGIIGAAWNDATVLAVGHAFEQATGHIAVPALAAGPFDIEATASAVRPLSN